MREALGRAKMVILPSESEGLPLSILEAMAYKRPVLVSRTGELANLIERLAILYPYGVVDAGDLPVKFQVKVGSSAVKTDDFPAAREAEIGTGRSAGSLAISQRWREVLN